MMTEVDSEIRLGNLLCCIIYYYIYIVLLVYAIYIKMHRAELTWDRPRSREEESVAIR